MDARGDITLEEFREQFEQLHKMGTFRDVIGAMPGMSEVIPEGYDPEQDLKRIQGVIDSMTRDERYHPEIIDVHRERRIAAGSGTASREVRQFLKQFESIRRLMRQMRRMGPFFRTD
jgi:signal recognition particle subunit SRP54